MQMRKLRGERQCLMALRLILMMGYEVCVERMPGRRWKSALCVRTCGCIVQTLLCGCSVFLSSHVCYVGRVWLKSNLVCKVHAWCSGWACNFCNLWEEMVVALEDKGFVIGG